ncbi:MAG TPA: ATP-binding protein [Acidobacteriaceae bacterium]|nr:ATP-binding protein [Acidobacteriaceae bacterium]
MTNEELVHRLAQHRTVGSAPRAELEWLVAHGEYRKLEAGELISIKGTEVRGLNIVLSGHIALFFDRGGGPDRIIEWRGGDVAGMLPYSRLSMSPGNSSAQEASELLVIYREDMPQMIRECHQVTSILVHTMLDRTRLFTSTELHNEKMISLGKLSAGLAHELNNPAAAIERCAALLQQRVEDSEEAARALAAVQLSDAEIAAFDRLRKACLGDGSPILRTPLEQSDREEEIIEWLMAHRVDMVCAQMLADTEITLPALDAFAATAPEGVLNAAIRCAAAGCAIRRLTAMIQDASSRISSLISAVKGFTNMDRANAAAMIELGPHLKNTVAVLASKATAKSATVTLAVEDGLPLVRGFAGELNQVWGNLLENALDAVGVGGRVNLAAKREGEYVLVRVIDDGPGIPVEIRGRIFDPFFTTKPQGQGTGLGLDIARRLVVHNDGKVEVEVRPGETEFRVTLPVAKG